MAQFTPYPDGHFQLHGMTDTITLFEHGLVESSANSAQPKLKHHFIDKIDKGWAEEEVKARTQRAIEHLRRFIPEFANNASVSAKPLFGAQQIPGVDADLRAAGVSFVGDHYARCEIVKASSAPSVADEIIKQLRILGYLSDKKTAKCEDHVTRSLSATEVTQYAQQITATRHYPTALARLNSKQPV